MSSYKLTFILLLYFWKIKKLVVAIWKNWFAVLFSTQVLVLLFEKLSKHYVKFFRVNPFRQEIHVQLKVKSFHRGIKISQKLKFGVQDSDSWNSIKWQLKFAKNWSNSARFLTESNDLFKFHVHDHILGTSKNSIDEHSSLGNVRFCIFLWWLPKLRPIYKSFQLPAIALSNEVFNHFLK